MLLNPKGNMEKLKEILHLTNPSAIAIKWFKDSLNFIAIVAFWTEGFVGRSIAFGFGKKNSVAAFRLVIFMKIYPYPPKSPFCMTWIMLTFSQRIFDFDEILWTKSTKKFNLPLPNKLLIKNHWTFQTLVLWRWKNVELR